MYNWTAPKVPDINFIGMLIFMELHRRIHDSQFGKVPDPLKGDAFGQRGYCIDAPDEMPAGGCCWFQCDAEDGLPVQITIKRIDTAQDA
ncbi:MAG TPA: hypothetical protein VJ654_00640, partial [Noviherbaspirillum sp.]|nr:hypothetical protein [Noviherbaspirillum sp.]